MEFDKLGKPDNAASLMSDAAAAFFQVDKEAHDVLRRRRKLYEEIERETAQETLRYQILTEERNKLLAKRKVARAMANEVSQLSVFHVDGAPPDWKLLLETLRVFESGGGGKFPDETLDKILAATEDEGFKLAKHTMVAATIPAGKTMATSNRFSSLDGSFHKPLEGRGGASDKQRRGRGGLEAFFANLVFCFRPPGRRRFSCGA